MGFLLAKPKLKTLKKSRKESRGAPYNKTPEGALNRKIGRSGKENGARPCQVARPPRATFLARRHGLASCYMTVSSTVSFSFASLGDRGFDLYST